LETRYPWPTQVTFNRGSEIIGPDFLKMIRKGYRMKSTPISVRNPQANAMIERVHQMSGVMIHTFE
jgi:transposase InsO family protein